MTIQWLRTDRAMRMRRRRSPTIYVAMIIAGFGAAVLIAVFH